MADKEAAPTAHKARTAAVHNEGEAPVVLGTASAIDNSKPANIPAATQFSTSGAPVQLVPDVDPNHPAVDADPRAGTTVNQNKIDFNDPTVSGPDAVAAALGMKTETEAEAARAADAKKDQAKA